jgi:hypothetical protein
MLDVDWKPYLRSEEVIGRLFSKNRKFPSLPLSRCLKRFTVVFKSSIFTPLNFFWTIAHSTAILGHRLSNFSTVNLRFFTYVGIQGEAAFLGQTLALCCECGKGIIVGSSPLTCSPGGKDHITALNRPPLAKMWQQEQFRWVIVHGLCAGLYNTVRDSYFRKTVKLIEKITQLS